MPEQKNFWKTLPGIITGIAAIITATTGLVVAINGTGLFKKSSPENQSTTVKSNNIAKPDNDSTPPVVKKDDMPGNVKRYKATLAMNQLKTETHEYKILDVSVEPMTSLINSLKIKIRYTNNSNYSQANFWNEGFRLSNDTLRIAPFGDLNELVDRHASLVGIVTFEVPNDIKSLTLHIYDEGGKDFTIPLKIEAN